MKNLIIVFCLMIGNTFLNGWFYMKGYELGVVPLINHLGVAPHIPYILFVLLAAAFSMVKSKTINNLKEEGMTPDNAVFWTKYVGIVGTDFMLLLILWAINCIFL
jgi:hypothetical protein